VVDGFSTTGGGSAPDSRLPTRLLAIRKAGLSAAELQQRLRLSDPPVIARIEHDEVLLDLRTVADAQDAELARTLAEAAGG
jgi:L-seryl-tRNA(Ser) seleniumtransferase